MTETLKPCPFCGYKARVESTRDAVGDHQGYVECMDCGATIFGPGDLPDAESAMSAAVDAWNRREQRTCRMEYQTGPDNPKRGWFECSECGGLGDSVGAGWNGEKKRKNPPAYCPNCGARVIGDES